MKKQNDKWITSVHKRWKHKKSNFFLSFLEATKWVNSIWDARIVKIIKLQIFVSDTDKSDFDGFISD